MYKIDWVFGPSHVVRWRKYIEDGIMHQEILPEKFVGSGGAPIWSKNLFEFAKKNVSSESTIAVFVGDFRFGNNICISNSENLQTFQNDFYNIDQSAISPSNDKKMLNRCLDAIKMWQEHFGHRVKFVFWCLFGRQVLDRLSGKYIVDRQYRHPTFNYDEIIKNVGISNIVDFAPLLKLPMHDVNCLFTDDSLHPSQIGILMLHKIFFENVDVLDSYITARQLVRNNIYEIIKGFTATKKITFILAGKSIWIDTFIKYFGYNEIDNIAKLGFLVVALDKEMGKNYIYQIMKILNNSGCKVIIFSDKNLSSYSSLLEENDFCESNWNNFIQIKWQYEAAPIIIARGERPNHKESVSNDFPLVKTIQIGLNDCMIEQGPAAVPTWEGIRFLLERLSNINI